MRLKRRGASSATGYGTSGSNDVYFTHQQRLNHVPARVIGALFAALCVGLFIPPAAGADEQRGPMTSPQHERASGDYPLKPIPFTAVKLTDSFWLPRLNTQREVLVPHALKQTEPGVRHLQAAADFLAGKGAPDHRPHRFIDSDLYKVIEGAAYLLQLERDPALEAEIDRIIDVIAAAQKSDGYLYPSHITGVGSAKHMMGDAPYQFVVHSHELYNVGHLYEAAIAYAQATRKDKLLKIAEKNAQHVNRVFFEGDANYNGGRPVNQAPGHQEIELALVKLAQATANPLYLKMADRFLAIRGRTYRPQGEGVMSPTYAQQHLPVAEQTEAVGHAVRAAYQYAAMADVGVLTGNDSYGKALDAIWHDIVNTRMHITGGLGAVHGIEGFGPRFVLPNADAYNETCAAVGNVLVNYRLFLLHGDAKYLDVAEVALLNNVLAGVNLPGNQFFYVNPLEADGDHPFNHGAAGRVDWFGTACCPTNLARLIPQVGGMTYAQRENSLYVTFFVGSESTLNLPGGPVGIRQETQYPSDGKIKIILTPKAAQRFALRLRIPTWTGGRFVPGDLYRYVDPEKAPWTVRVNGQQVEAPTTEHGFVVLDREWRAGDEVELHLPMPVCFNTCDERVEANRGRVAITRGPLVMCAEGTDNGVVQRLALEQIPAADAIAVGSTEIATGHEAVSVTLPASAVGAEGAAPVKLKLIPYYAWNNRGNGSMIVWLPRQAEMVRYFNGERLIGSAFGPVRASHTFEKDTVAALVDGQRPRNSGDGSIRRWTSWPEKGKAQWATVEFKKPQALRSVGVYWYDDKGGVQVPVEWNLAVRTNGQWKPMQLYVTDSYQLQPDQYNVVHPAAAMTCDAIRINMTPKADAAVGILDLNVEFEGADE
ncbi:MAG TPA: beta-L-arabinofuranosidase domain-containing protein [Tepidisphaeraceae bacterium]|nr:beta-L-arabinofuranosidase domain-containing protein [Tepidisphaeraceae bacterium]